MTDDLCLFDRPFLMTNQYIELKESKDIISKTWFLQNLLPYFVTFDLRPRDNPTSDYANGDTIHTGHFKSLQVKGQGHKKFRTAIEHPITT